MRGSKTSAAALLALGLLAGIGTVVLYRSVISAPFDPFPEAFPDAETDRSRQRPAPPGGGDAIDSAGGAARSPHAEALRHPSEAFRNTSLIAVVRGAGYVCTEIVSSAPGNEAQTAWRVSCENAHAFLVSEDEAGVLHVEPIPFIELPVPPFAPMPVPDRLQPVPDRLPPVPPPPR
jgi:hypothetical protein